eukprot:gene28513-31818_t
MLNTGQQTLDRFGCDTVLGKTNGSFRSRNTIDPFGYPNNSARHRFAPTTLAPAVRSPHRPSALPRGPSFVRRPNSMWMFDRFAKNLIKRGELTIIDADGKQYHYGTPDPAFKPVTLRFADKKVASYIARHPRLGAALAWMDGRLLVDNDDIAGMIDLI